MELMRNDAEAEWVFPNIACELLGCSDQTLRRKASEWGIRKRQYKGLSHRRDNRPDIERFLADNDARAGGGRGGAGGDRRPGPRAGTDSQGPETQHGGGLTWRGRGPYPDRLVGMIPIS